MVATQSHNTTISTQYKNLLPHVEVSPYRRRAHRQVDTSTPLPAPPRPPQPSQTEGQRGMEWDHNMCVPVQYGSVKTVFYSSLKRKHDRTESEVPLYPTQFCSEWRRAKKKKKPKILLWVQQWLICFKARSVRRTEESLILPKCEGVAVPPPFSGKIVALVRSPNYVRLFTLPWAYLDGNIGRVATDTGRLRIATTRTQAFT